MTNNVVASDSQTSLDVSITLALSNAAVFQASSSNSMPSSPMRYVAIKKMKKAESHVVCPAIETWLSSLRAASPTRTITTVMSRKMEDTGPNIRDRPSALSMFEDIVKRCEGRPIAIFLDYDGTLSPIVQEPDKAYLSDEMREVVRDIATCFPTAIVTGRCRDKVYNLVGLGGLFYAGSHGMDIRGPSSHKSRKPVVLQPAREFIPMINEVQKELREKTKSIKGCKVENNKFCLAVHFRSVDERMWALLAEQVLSVLSNYPKLKLSAGRKVLEIRPAIKWDKGKAVEFLLESLGNKFEIGYGDSDHVLPIYIGDDRTDEDAFKVLKDRRLGVGILVSEQPKETCASYSLKEPNEVKEFLRRLVQWRRM